MGPIIYNLTFPTEPSLKALVLRLSGAASLNNVYEINITSLIEFIDKSIDDFSFLLNLPFTLTIGKPALVESEASTSDTADLLTFSGLVTSYRLQERLGDYLVFKLRVGPKLCLLKNLKQNRIHLNLNSLEIIKESLKFGGLNSEALKINAKWTDYPRREFIFQYEESLIDFILRTLEREGLSMHFESQLGQEFIVITDAPQQKPSLKRADSEIEIIFRQSSGLNPEGEEAQIYNLKRFEKLPPHKLLLKEYDWENPLRALNVFGLVSETGRGQAHLYGENFNSLAEGQRLFNIRKEEFISASESFSGQSSLAGLKPGYSFKVKNHPLESFNDRFLLIKTFFSGSLAGSISSRLGYDFGLDEKFKHVFEFRRLSTPFRPQRVIKAPKISGSLNAFIDGAGSGKNPELDDYGRYKVLLPLDLSGRANGSASSWLRLAQPHSGKGFGQHFPLLPGTEVMLSFIDSNPDRPVIASAVPNAESAGLINNATSNLSGFTTRGGSSLLFDDREQKQKVSLSSGSNRAALHLTTNSPTNLSLHADTINIITMQNLSIFGLFNHIFSPISHTIEANANLPFLQAFNLISAAEGSSTAANDLSQAITDNPEAGTVSGLNKSNASVLASGLTSIFNLSLDSIFTLCNCAATIASLKSTPSQFNPHRNLISIMADGNNAKLQLNAKDNGLSGFMALFSFVTQLGQMASSVGNTARNIGELSNKTKSESDSSNYSPTAIDLKKASYWAASGSNALNVIFQLLLSLPVVKGLASKGTKKGCSIENKHSYLALKAFHSASLSTHGPIIIESTKANLANLLTLGDFDNLKPLEPIKSESLNENADWEKSKTILTSSELIKTLAEEIALYSDNSLIAKSGSLVQILSGPRAEEINQTTLFDTKLTALKAIGNSTNSIPDSPKAPLAQLSREFFQTKGQSYDSEFNQGLIYKTQTNGAPLMISTASVQSEISFIQGDSDLNSPKAAALNLSEQGLLARASEKIKLILSALPAKASIEVNDDCALTIEENSNELKAPNASLKLDLSSIALKGLTSIELECAQSKLKITPQEITFSLPGKTVTLSALISKYE
ncbi:MAG: type VI secretion system tip protein VgrG [Deltaproteobacteria bacterium]|jgi:type VI secretion system VgrG family protein|nr:type VI secretion system tip protein VgrG [Deltaproteobacteria bacterium]